MVTVYKSPLPAGAPRLATFSPFEPVGPLMVTFNNARGIPLRNERSRGMRILDFGTRIEGLTGLNPVNPLILLIMVGLADLNQLGNTLDSSTHFGGAGRFSVDATGLNQVGKIRDLVDAGKLISGGRGRDLFNSLNCPVSSGAAWAT